MVSGCRRRVVNERKTHRGLNTLRQEGALLVDEHPFTVIFEAKGPDLRRFQFDTHGGLDGVDVQG